MVAKMKIPLPLYAAVILLCCIFGTTYAQVTDPCRTDAYPPPKDTEIETVVVNLDLPPVERWRHVVLPKKAALKELLNVFHQIIGPKALKYVNYVIGLLGSLLPEEYGDEMRGMSMDLEMERGEVILYNIFYEFFTVCTSIIAQDEKGKMYHARNMDFGLFMGWDVKNNTWMTSEVLRKLLVNVEFQKNGKTVYQAATFAGYVGVLTAMKKDAFTFSIDERFVLNGGYVGLFQWLLSRGTNGAKWLGFFTRDVMLNATSYDHAKNMFAKQELIAPAYFILGGTKAGEGAVITRDRKGVADMWELTTSHRWYLVETNYDHWEKPLFFDDRRTPAMKCLNETTQNGLGFKGLFNVLSTKPVLNKLTVYSCLMQVNEGKFEMYRQDCRDPCWPW